MKCFPGDAVIKKLPANPRDAGDAGLCPGSGRPPGVQNSSLLQFPCLGNSIDREAWGAIIHGVAKSQTWLNTHTHSWFTMLCQFLLYSKLTQLYTYIHSFLHYFHYGLSQDIEYSSLCHTVGSVVCVRAHSVSHFWLFVTPWTVACQDPLSTKCSKQACWGGSPCPPSRGSSWPRDWTCISFISCTGRRILCHCTTWEGQIRCLRRSLILMRFPLINALAAPFQFWNFYYHSVINLSNFPSGFFFWSMIILMRLFFP